MKANKICVIALTGLMLVVFTSGIACAQTTLWPWGTSPDYSYITSSGGSAAWESGSPITSNVGPLSGNSQTWLDWNNKFQNTYSYQYYPTLWTYDGVGDNQYESDQNALSTGSPTWSYAGSLQMGMTGSDCPIYVYQEYGTSVGGDSTYAYGSMAYNT
jgi:hypothetical protein